jgi:hypothetical protein
VGCFNLITEDDLQQMSDALNAASSSPSGTLAFQLVSDAQTLQRLADLLISPELFQETRTSIFPALAAIGSITGDPLGLYSYPPSYYGPGAKGGVLEKMRTERNAEAAAYELTGAAALVQHSIKDVSGKGPELFIQVGDRLDFGIKQQARYAGAPELMPDQPATRRTIESDLIIHRTHYDFGVIPRQEVIGVDFKHTQMGPYHHNTNELRDQLKGVVTAIRTGELHQFCFVTNKEFTPAFKREIEHANQLVARDAGGDLTRAEEKEFLTAEELKQEGVPKVPLIHVYQYVNFSP